jgi:4-amino-4-deoxy-L-arabinose transferase-like glycosyltransferase
MRLGPPGRIALPAALITFAVHLVANPHYGFFRDELYFIICGFHPAWGYVDQPPVVPLLAAGSQLFGRSLIAVRAICAFFAAACVYTTCMLALELGGGAFAVLFAALLAAITPVLMDFGTKLSTDTPGIWLWPLAALYVLRIVKGADPRWWLAVGAIFGIAVESKYTVLFLMLGMIGGLALSQRRALRTPWFVAGAVLGVLIALPNFLWQAAHHYPMLMLLRDAGAYRNVVLSPLEYLVTQVLIAHPLLAPVWLIGLIALLRGAQTRFLGIAYLFLIAAMVAFHGKNYYPGDVYPIPIAAGAVAVEAWSARRARVRPVLIAYVALVGSLLVPLLMPVLPETTMSAYDRVVVSLLSQEVALAKTEHREIGNLPPDWGDMHGWPELTAQVAQVYRSLPAAQRPDAAIIASNYGEASALNFFGPQYGLPPAISGNNQYWLWGPHANSGNVLIEVNGECDRTLFRKGRVVAHFSNRWARPFENGLPISLCEGIRTPLAVYWPRLRSYI